MFLLENGDYSHSQLIQLIQVLKFIFKYFFSIFQLNLFPPKKEARFWKRSKSIKFVTPISEGYCCQLQRCDFTYSKFFFLNFREKSSFVNFFLPHNREKVPGTTYILLLNDHGICTPEVELTIIFDHARKFVPDIVLIGFLFFF